MDMRTPDDRLRDAGGTTEYFEPDDASRGEGKPQTAREFLAIEAWLERDIPAPDRLLGDLLTTTSRVFLVGRTGLGKTLVAVGMGCGIASGRGFLHWSCHRPGRVLLIDGEMPSELIKSRARDAVRRLNRPIPPGEMTIYARDLDEEFAEKFPKVGRMSPLNTEEGKSWLLALIEEIGGVDVVILDNVMSLIGGDQKDEISWSETLPLVQTLSGKRIGQVWLDHTGHNQDRQYGSSTKAWRFDAVGIMAPLPEEEREDHEVAFTLSFDHPGKARRRTPENWRDFETRTIRLKDDQWSSDATDKSTLKAGKLAPVAEQFYRALLDAFSVTETPGKTTRSAWFAECVRVGLADAIEPGDDRQAKASKQAKFRKYLSEFRVAGLIGVDSEMVSDLRRKEP